MVLLGGAGESFWMLVGDWVFGRESIRLAWEGGQLKKKDGLLISGQPSWRGFSGMFIVDFSFASTGKFFFSCFCWFLDDFCWLGVSMLISLSLMIFVEDLFGSVPVSLWDICNLVLIFIWYLFDFTHPHMSSLINIWNEACMNWSRSYCLHSVFIFPCFWYLFVECIIIPISARGSKELQRIHLQWWMGYMLPYESCRQESVFSERGSWGHREIWRAWKARLLERVDCEEQAGHLRSREGL